ncbi:MAG: glutamyl-tRNA reductase [Nitrospirae bacterium]|nr:MAG: glutamyl-tRNA reductase [Nitrospirota bacterium]
MNIIIVGLNHRTAPVELRERLAVPESRLPEAVARLKGWPGVAEALILSTCNRVELYAVVKDTALGFESLREYFVKIAPTVSGEELVPYLYYFDGHDAIRHLFRVTSSLDSMVVGEPQILGQVKVAFDVALTQKTTGVVLNKVLKKAISVGKRVRSETGIAANAVSVSYAAVELAKKIFQNFAGKTVLLIGAGEMAKLAARHLMQAGMQNVMITTRNFELAVDVAKHFNGLPVPFNDFPEEMSNADIVICSTGAASYLVTAEDVQKALWTRRNRPMFLIDISVPRNIEPAVGAVDNAYLYNIDDLQGHVEKNLEQRRQEAMKAEDLVKDEVGLVTRWIKSLEVLPTILALRRKADDIQKGELERILSRLGPLTPRQRELVEELASAISNKLLHGALVALKAEADSTNGPLFTEIAQRLFDLEKEIEASQLKEAAEETRTVSPDDVH